jgi:hypothetical protein
VDEARIIAATGKEPGEWFTILDERGARELPHKEIARILREELGVPSWWSQMVTVEYEKHIGRRETGQRGGSWSSTTSRTVPGTMDEVLERWLALLAAAPEQDAFDGVPWAAEPAVSRTEKRRYWRVPLADGSKVTVTISDKPGGDGSILAATSDKLAGKEDAGRWKAYWKAFLAGL